MLILCFLVLIFLGDVRFKYGEYLLQIQYADHKFMDFFLNKPEQITVVPCTQESGYDECQHNSMGNYSERITHRRIECSDVGQKHDEENLKNKLDYGSKESIAVHHFNPFFRNSYQRI